MSKTRVPSSEKTSEPEQTGEIVISGLDTPAVPSTQLEPPIVVQALLHGLLDASPDAEPEDEDG